MHRFTQILCAFCVVVALSIAAAVLGVTGLASAELKTPTEGSYNLPLKGSYGNNSGCNALAENWDAADDDMLYITSETYRGWESGCHYVHAFGEFEPSYGTRAWTVFASCSGEGIPCSQLLTVWEQPNEKKVTIIDEPTPAYERPVELSRCN